MHAAAGAAAGAHGCVEGERAGFGRRAPWQRLKGDGAVNARSTHIGCTCAAAQPHTTLELLPYDPGELSNFKEFLDSHLRCQIRDCFVGMGLHPPEEFRVLGYGKFIYARRYGQYEMYPEYHDPNENELLA